MPTRRQVLHGMGTLAAGGLALGSPLFREIIRSAPMAWLLAFRAHWRATGLRC